MTNYLPNFNPVSIYWGKSTDLVTILDTNIISYLLIPEAHKQIESFFHKLKLVAIILKLDDVIAFSAISIYENLISEDISRYIDLLKKMLCFEISNDVIYTTTQIRKYYKKHGISLENIPDLIISATAYLNSSSILTGNQSDYKSPLFKEIQSSYISWKEKGRTKGITLYLLRPNYDKVKREELLPSIFS